MTCPRKTIDLGLILGTLNHPQYEVLQMSCDPLVAVVPIHYRLSTRPEVTLADLAHYLMVMGSMPKWPTFR